MNSRIWNRWFLLGSVISVVAILFVKQTNGDPKQRLSVPYDWSHRHVVFSQPSSIWQAWKLQQEPRYWQQVLRRNVAARLGNEMSTLGANQDSDLNEFRKIPKKLPIRRDWAESLGPGASTGTSTYSQFPAKFTFDISPNSESCGDYIVFPTNAPGVTGTSEALPGQPSVIAFQNLYAGTNGACGATPTIAWAYNTNASGDTTGVVNGSPVLSFDGTKVAFVESNSAGSILHLLSYTVGDGTDANGVMVVAPPTALLTSGGWSSCPANGSSCMISLTFATGKVSNSSPFYRYGTDELYVGDDNGMLHKFTGVFNGTPTELTTGGWPITVNAGAILSSPIFDAQSNNAFITDSSGRLSFVRDAGSVSGSCAGSPPCLGLTSLSVGVSNAVLDPPMVDPSTEKVFAFSGNNGLGSATVVQANTDLSSGVTIAVGAAGAPLHTGAFDNAYLSSSPGSISGFLYLCGKVSPLIDRPALRQIRFNSTGTMSNVSLTALQVGNLSGSQCSPVTEIFNGGTDFIFFSVQSGGRTNSGFNCAGGGGCVMSAIITSGTVPTSVAASLAETGGTSGIVIDNVGTFGQDSSLYFSRLGQSSLSSCGGSGGGLVGCAVKLTQSGLN